MKQAPLASRLVLRAVPALQWPERAPKIFRAGAEVE